MRSNAWGTSPFLNRKSPVFEESMKDRGSMYEHFASGGSARAAVGGRLLKKPFCTKHLFGDFFTFFWLFGRVVLSVSEEILVSL